MSTVRAYLERRTEENIVGLLRWSHHAGMAIFPPALSGDRQWYERESGLTKREHAIEEVAAALRGEHAIHLR